MEVAYAVYNGDFEGHYRLSYWSNETAHSQLLNPAEMSNNAGVGFSFDQALSEQFGIWGRFGMQDGSVAEFDRHVSLGAEFKGAFGRPDDVVGLAFATTWISDEHKQASGFSDNEQIAEAYYKLAVGKGLTITPDLQYVAHPAGNGTIDPLTVYGFRVQLDL